jgi:ClpP class serine protease
MSGDAVLGPVDPQLGQYPAASILKAVARKPIERVEDQTLILADQSEKVMSQVRESVRELLAGKCPPEKAEQLAHLLSEGTSTHDSPITFEKAKDFGLPVRNDIPHGLPRTDESLSSTGSSPTLAEYIPERRYSGDRPERG